MTFTEYLLTRPEFANLPAEKKNELARDLGRIEAMPKDALAKVFAFAKSIPLFIGPVDVESVEVETNTFACQNCDQTFTDKARLYSHDYKAHVEHQ